jgi:hypothetical protein
MLQSIALTQARARAWLQGIVLTQARGRAWLQQPPQLSATLITTAPVPTRLHDSKLVATSLQMLAMSLHNNRVDSGSTASKDQPARFLSTLRKAASHTTPDPGLTAQLLNHAPCISTPTT